MVIKVFGKFNFVEQNKISHSGATHGNKWCNAGAGGNKNRLACGRSEGEISVGTCHPKAGTYFGISQDWRKKAFLYKVHAERKIWISRRGKQGIVSF